MTSCWVGIVSKSYSCVPELRVQATTFRKNTSDFCQVWERMQDLTDVFESCLTHPDVCIVQSTNPFHFVLLNLLPETNPQCAGYYGPLQSNMVAAKDPSYILQFFQWPGEERQWCICFFSPLVYGGPVMFCLCFNGFSALIKVDRHVNSCSNCCLQRDKHWNLFLLCYLAAASSLLSIVLFICIEQFKSKNMQSQGTNTYYCPIA